MTVSHSSANALVCVEDLSKHFVRERTRTIAVSGASFTIYRGETLGLVGESGSGKSTLGRLLLRLLPPTRGRVVFDGIDTMALRHRELQALRRRMQIVFQNPYSALNPRMRIGQALEEPLRAHGLGDGAAARQARVVELLALVGIEAEAANRYPHAFSGGQRQRIGIARALSLQPEFLVADEAVSALDVSVQAQVLNLLGDLQQKLQLTLLFISHDLSVVEHLSDRIAVMYRGELIELGEARAVAQAPKHPYTQSLWLASSRPVAAPSPAAVSPPAAKPSTAMAPTGSDASPSSPPGCAFVARCPLAVEGLCDSERPVLRDRGNGHAVACHRVSDP